MTGAFVAGATGYTGREVVRVLGERGVAPVAHVRPDSPRLADWRARFAAMGAEVDATPWEEPAMTETLRRLRPAVVFALLGTTRARMRERARTGGDPAGESYEAVDYGLTAHLIRAAAACGARPRVVYLSSAGIRPGSGNPYFQARWKAEEDLRRSGLPFVIARPSFITGSDRDDRRTLERVGARAVDGALAVAGLLGARKLRERYRSTSNAALARALVRLALDPGAEDRAFESEDLRDP
jgi:uncharacterized protein YbjT (DUF2867 family)